VADSKDRRIFAETTGLARLEVLLLLIEPLGLVSVRTAKNGGRTAGTSCFSPPRNPSA